MNLCGCCNHKALFNCCEEFSYKNNLIAEFFGRFTFAFFLNPKVLVNYILGVPNEKIYFCDQNKDILCSLTGTGINVD